MEPIKATTNFFLDKRKQKRQGKYPIKLSVYFNGEKKRYKTGLDVTEDKWVKLHAAYLRDDQLKLSKRKLNNMLEKATKIIDSISDFSFRSFENQYFKERQIQSN